MCSLAKAYGYIAAAIGALGAAMASALIYFNIPGLLVAAGLVATVSFLLIPAIKNEMSQYETCRGTNTQCPPMGYNINLLGQIASIISFVAFAAAAALFIFAATFIVSVILAWLGVALATAAGVLQYSGVATCGIVILLLIGLATNLKGYEDCRNREASPSA